MVSDAYIWMDYTSVPQIGNYLDAGVSDLMKAVESIPAYGEFSVIAFNLLVCCANVITPPHYSVEKASHFFAVTPTVTHADLPSVTCNYGSWLERGWCRLEMISLLLSRFNDHPVIVVRGPECQPYMISPFTIMARPPGGGELTWCVRWGLWRASVGWSWLVGFVAKFYLLRTSYPIRQHLHTAAPATTRCAILMARHGRFPVTATRSGRSCGRCSSRRSNMSDVRAGGARWRNTGSGLR